MVGGEGFEPSKAQGQQIYSLSRLTASVPTHECGGRTISKMHKVGKKAYSPIKKLPRAGFFMAIFYNKERSGIARNKNTHDVRGCFYGAVDRN